MAPYLYTIQHIPSVIKTNAATDGQSLSVLSSPSTSVSHEKKTFRQHTPLQLKRILISSKLGDSQVNNINPRLLQNLSSLKEAYKLLTTNKFYKDRI